MAKDAWFGVEIRHLEVLVAVAKEESFRGAADRLDYVQSAISQRLATLEHLVGARLVERARGSRQLHLTEHGSLLVGHAEAILARLSIARSDFELHTEGQWVVRLGISRAVAPALLPGLLQGVAQRSAALRVLPVEADDGRLEDLLEQGAIDAAIGDLAPVPDINFESTSILTDFSSLLFNPRCGWAKELESPSAAAIARVPLIGVEDDSHLARVETWLAAEGLRAEIRKVPTETTARALAAAGSGAAIVPSLSVALPGERTVATSLRGLLPGREVALHWRATADQRPDLPTLRAAARAAAAAVRGSAAAEREALCAAS